MAGELAFDRWKYHLSRIWRPWEWGWGTVVEKDVGGGADKWKNW